MVSRVTPKFSRLFSIDIWPAALDLRPAVYFSKKSNEIVLYHTLCTMLYTWNSNNKTIRDLFSHSNGLVGLDSTSAQRV